VKTTGQPLKKLTLPVWGVVAALVLSGCQSAPDPEPGTPGPDPVIDREVIVIIPDFFPDGSATDNLPYMDYVLTTAGAGKTLLGSVDAVTALEDAGFFREAIEVTPDRTALNLEAESVTVAVLIDDECAIGQWSKQWYVSSVSPLLGSGTCLLGDTLSLD
jgi:hypothetical protein